MPIRIQVMVANTDTIHYQHLCQTIYRFQPVTLSKDDISRFHGIDERISVDNFNQVCTSYFVAGLHPILPTFFFRWWNFTIDLSATLITT